MYRKQLHIVSAFLLAGVSIGTSCVWALNFEPGVGAGLQFTDNAALTADAEDSDWIAIGYVGARIEQNSGPLRANATTSINHQHYTQNTFSDKTYFNLGATADWAMVKNRLNWQLQNFFTQRPVDSTDPDTPDNTQNTNVFTFGPTLRFPLSGRQQLTLSPTYRNFYYETEDTDNQQYSLTASWLYQMYRLTAIGLDGAVNLVEYDDEQRNPNHTISDIHLVVSGQRARSEFALSLGATHISRDRFESQNGFTGNLSWLVTLTGHSRVRTYIASELTDANNGLLNASVNPDDGDFSNEQVSGDVLRNNIIRFEYLRQDTTLNSRFWGELRDLDYKETPDDREVQAFGVTFSYPLTALLTSGLYGRYNRTKLTDENRTDKRYEIGADVSYQLTPKLSGVLDVQYRNKDSTGDINEYTEMSAFVSLVYGFGQVSRANQGGGG